MPAFSLCCAFFHLNHVDNHHFPELPILNHSVGIAATFTQAILPLTSNVSPSLWGVNVSPTLPSDDGIYRPNRDIVGFSQLFGSGALVVFSLNSQDLQCFEFGIPIALAIPDTPVCGSAHIFPMSNGLKVMRVDTSWVSALMV
jgi:hypothetical protein